MKKEWEDTMERNKKIKIKRVKKRTDLDKIIKNGNMRFFGFFSSVNGPSIYQSFPTACPKWWSTIP